MPHSTLLHDTYRRLGGFISRDEGVSLTEVMVATFVFTVAILGIVGIMGSSLSLVGSSKQRSAGTQIAQERLERAHNLPYNRVALCVSADPTSGCTTPAHSADANNPDSAVVDGSPPTYQVDPSTQEPLVSDAANGAIRHVDDPVQLGTTTFTVYQYVTWHDDPAIASTPCPTGGATTCDDKRVVVVVSWKYPVYNGPSHSVTASTLIGAGGVIEPATTPPPAATATPIPTQTPTPTGTPAPAACGSMQILSSTGAQQGYTNSTTLQIQATNTNGSCTSLALSNDGTTFTTVATTFPATVTWSIPPGDGTKTIYAKFNNSGGGSVTVTSAVVLDKTAPTTPTSPQKASCAISANTRSVTLTWTASTDTNLIGYRLYKQTNSGAFAQVTTSITQQASDSSSKGDNVTYYVTAYDKAGNESTASNNVAFTKNNC